VGFGFRVLGLGSWETEGEYGERRKKKNFLAETAKEAEKNV
jgi:hypothetical protein